MPMPPPRASIEGRDPVVAHQIQLIRRALAAEGAQGLGGLAALLGTRFWTTGELERALTIALANGTVLLTADHRYALP